jgi:hypothetical protein
MEISENDVVYYYNERLFEKEEFTIFEIHMATNKY